MVDAVTFSDQTFPSYASIRPTADTGGGQRLKMRDAQVLTEDLYYNDQETNTKFKKAAISVIIVYKVKCRYKQRR